MKNILEDRARRDRIRRFLVALAAIHGLALLAALFIVLLYHLQLVGVILIAVILIVGTAWMISS